MHSARAWYGGDPSTYTFQTMDAATLSATGVLDANGWPTAIPTADGTTAVSTMWAAGGYEQNENYVLSYDGTGTITLNAAGAQVSIVSSEPGRIVFSVSGAPDAGLQMSITSTDPDHTGDYIRDISMVPEKDEALAATGEIFNPDFLATIDDAREIRFMDWMTTNSSTQVDWSDRPQVSDYSWALGKGVPVEVMVQLANQIGAEPWFNMPAEANDDYVTQFATYVRDHLDPDLQAHVEWSNEVWNWGLGTQTQWADQQAKALLESGAQALGWGEPTNLDYQAMRATQVGAIWDGVFGADAKQRVDNVLGIQTGQCLVAAIQYADGGRMEGDGRSQLHRSQDGVRFGGGDHLFRRFHAQRHHAAQPSCSTI